MQLQLLKDCILDSEFLKLHNVFFKLCFITQSTMKEKTPYLCNMPSLTGNLLCSL